MLSREEYRTINQRKAMRDDIKKNIPYHVYAGQMHPTQTPRFTENFLLSELFRLIKKTGNDKPYQMVLSETLRDSFQPTRKMANRIINVFDNMRWNNYKNKIVWIHLDYTLYTETQVQNIIKYYLEEAELSQEHVDLSEVLTKMLESDTDLKTTVESHLDALKNIPFQSPQVLKCNSFEEMIRSNKILYHKNSNLITVINYGPTDRGGMLSTTSLPIFLLISQLFREDLNKGSGIPADFLNACIALYNAHITNQTDMQSKLRKDIEGLVAKPSTNEEVKESIKKQLKAVVDSSVQNYLIQLRDVEDELLRAFEKKINLKKKLQDAVTVNEENHLIMKLVGDMDKFPNVYDIEVKLHSRETITCNIWCLGNVEIEEQFIHLNFLRDKQERRFYEAIRDREITFYMFGGISLTFINGVIQAIDPIKIDGMPDLPIQNQEYVSNAIMKNPHHFHYRCLGSWRSEIMKAIQADNSFGVLINCVKAVVSLNLSDSAARGQVRPLNTMIRDLKTGKVLAYSEYLTAHKGENPV